MLEKIHRNLFFIIIFLIPLNLGKHFIFRFSYVNGLLSDYLIPTLFVTDLLIILLLLIWFVDLLINLKPFNFKSNYLSFLFLTLYLASVFLSISNSDRPEPGFFAYIRLILYVLFFIYVINNFDFKRDLKTFLIVVCASVILQTVLSLLQWINQGSVFNNYLFFGEQPYSFSTQGIVKESLFGVSKIPPYGTFRHPNVLAAFMSLFLVFIAFAGIKAKVDKRLLVVAFVGGFSVLAISFSRFAIISFVFAVVSYFLISKLKKLGATVCLLIVLLIILAGISLPAIPFKQFLIKDPSFSIRADLIKATYKTVGQDILFGVGLNNNLVQIKDLLLKNEFLRFIQPVHNLFLLVLSESGVFALTFFVLFLYSVLYKLFSVSNFSDPVWRVLLINVFQLLILGSFDHYFLTIHQTMLIFWLTLGISLKYNLNT